MGINSAFKGLKVKYYDNDGYYIWKITEVLYQLKR